MSEPTVTVGYSSGNGFVSSNLLGKHWIWPVSLLVFRRSAGVPVVGRSRKQRMASYPLSVSTLLQYKT